MVLQRIFSKLKTNAANFRLYRKHLTVQKQSGKNSRGTIYFDISNPALERYFYGLVKFFDIAGYSIKLKYNLNLLLNLRNYSNLIYGIEDLEIVKSVPENYELWITDSDQNLTGNKKIKLDINYFKLGKESDSAVFSYSMHPLIYEKKIYKTIPELRRVERNIRVFSYSAKLDSYETDEITNLFKKLNRKKVLLQAQNFPDKKALTIIERPENLSDLYTKELELTVVNDVRIEISDWLKTLAHADFFIAPPGVIMPFSHNLIEAMAVGTIPITQYGELFSPPLTDMVNCICFKDEADLTSKIKMVLEMNKEKIAQLRANATAYYDNFFEPNSVVSNLLEHGDEIKKLYLLAGHLSVTAYKKEN